MAVDFVAADCTVKEECGQATKTVIFRTPATVVSTDIIKVTLSTYGITNLLRVNLYVHTTVDSAISVETPSLMAVASKILSVTVPSGNDSKVRVLEVVGY